MNSLTREDIIRIVDTARQKDSTVVIDISHQNIVGVELNSLNLSNVNFSGSRITGVRFSDSDLTGANFHGATLQDVNFGYSNLTGAVFCPRTPLPRQLYQCCHEGD